MNYIEAREYMKGVQKSGIRLGLERMKELMQLLNNPQDKVKTIHVAGTNGKGSTINYIATILTANGYMTGRYTSPAVEDVREQYVIDGSWISEDDYVEYVTRMKTVVDRMCAIHMQTDEAYEAPTAFEIETAMAFLYFYEKGCDYLVLETGMGGREDATNVLSNTCVEVFTSIAEDHIGMIGNNLTEIARTKAGIIKEESRVVLQCNSTEVIDVIRQECDCKNAELTVIDRTDVILHDHKDGIRSFDYGDYKNISLKQKGSYQVDNAVLALETIDTLCSADAELVIDKSKTKQALCNASWPYRMECISDEPLFYLDGAHNPDAALRLRESIEEEYKGYKLIFIIGMFKDKDYRQVIRIMCPLATDIIAVETPRSPRALPRDVLKGTIADGISETNAELNSLKAMDVEDAVGYAIKLAKAYETGGERSMILAFGSLSYIALVKKILNNNG